MAKRFREKPYTLFSRKLASGTTTFYYHAYNESGKRTNPVSTGIGFTRKKDEVRTRREAEAYCMELFKHDQLIQYTAPTLKEWYESRHFWDFHRSKYVRSILARSSKEKPGITENYCNTGAQVTKDHILPYHGEKKINEITPYDCEQLLFQWIQSTENRKRKGGISNKTANNWKCFYSTLLGEYERELKMRNPKAEYFNPWKMVDPLIADKKSYGALTVSETKQVISPEGIEFDKDQQRIYYYATKLAFLTGLRIGEVCGLITNDVQDMTVSRDGAEITMSYLRVEKQWNAKEKRRTLVKDKDMRSVPITQELRKDLDQFMTGSSRFLFSFHPRQEHPINQNRLREWFYARLEFVGIKDREQRNIAFHSSRRFFNTLLRHGNVADDMLRRFTGHDSQEMTDHYTDYLPEDLQAISQAQSKLLTGGIQNE